MQYTLYRNAEIFTPHDHGRPLAGELQAAVAHYSGGALLVRDGLVAGIGDEAEVVERIEDDSTIQVREMDGRCLIPGFVDPHTHMCFAARREGEFLERISGTPYLEI